MSDTVDDGELSRFWAAAQGHEGVGNFDVVMGETPTGALAPQAWSFGDTPELADQLLERVLTGAKTATSTALWEFEAGGEELPEVDGAAILLDGAGHPRAFIRTTSVRVVPFSDVDEAFAAAEGEDDGSLAAWRTSHEQYFRRRASDAGGQPYTPDLQVVLEEFELVYPDLPTP
ncbi:MAG: ASCH domain-containing protein [Cellulomonas sp.]